MTNELTKDIALADGKACYDAYCKRILANKSILTWILKFTVSEFAEMTFSQIRNCIDGDPEISSERIEPGYTNSRITDYVSGIPDRVKGYDKLSVIIICLNETSENQSQLTAMLNTLLSSRLPVKEKIQNLENKFQIKVNNDLGKELNQMCNLSDLVEERGMEIDLHRLPEVLGDIPVVPVSARKRTGLDVLMHAVVHHYQEIPDEKVVTYSDEIENKIEQLIERLKKEYGDDHQILRWHAIKLLENDETVTKEHPILIEDIVDRSYENEIINQKYEYIEEVVEECLFNRDEKVAFTEKIDKWLTHPFWGLPIFLGIIALVFFFTFTIGDFLKGYFEVGLELFSGMVTSLLEATNVSDWMVSLIVDGIIAGVGGILTFLPNIFILFLALALLEDSGYMARVAYVMDGVMGKVGLSGKAFLPMVLGFGCTVPAVMATRALEKEADRKRTIC